MRKTWKYNHIIIIIIIIIIPSYVSIVIIMGPSSSYLSALPVPSLFSLFLWRSAVLHLFIKLN
eukprot:gene11645-8029_t